MTWTTVSIQQTMETTLKDSLKKKKKDSEKPINIANVQFFNADSLF